VEFFFGLRIQSPNEMQRGCGQEHGRNGNRASQGSKRKKCHQHFRAEPQSDGGKKLLTPTGLHV
jgi:hypothetical protein